MSPIEINLQEPRSRKVLRSSDRIVASEDGTHFFTFRPDWPGPVPLPFRAAAAALDLVSTVEERPREVLILGFGLGAIGGMMIRSEPAPRIVGVEPLNKLYQAARDALPDGIELVRADAATYLRRSTGRFDLILDDCFEIRDVEGESQPYRPPRLEVLPELAKATLHPGGLYVRNLLDQDDLGIDQQLDRVRASFQHLELRSFRDWDNVLLVASDGKLPEREVRRLGARRAAP